MPKQHIYPCILENVWLYLVQNPVSCILVFETNSCKVEATCISCRLGADFPCFPSQSSARKTFSITIRRKHPPAPSIRGRQNIPANHHQIQKNKTKKITQRNKRNPSEDSKIYLPTILFNKVTTFFFNQTNKLVQRMIQYMYLLSILGFGIPPWPGN